MCVLSPDLINRPWLDLHDRLCAAASEMNTIDVVLLSRNNLALGCTHYFFEGILYLPNSLSFPAEIL
ncbi:Protein of unknown function [Pyronema omphalodes CBS 100304]|uniref:Uncharacterized protein n=1 Tax=Pyronema omphalodes (strain CBS 100304) TaxID=1076935 RepID=U4LKF6_PYROM|nr:Protein of unknown function [Pyronema omphalodes CBS 100304]